MVSMIVTSSLVKPLGTKINTIIRLKEDKLVILVKIISIILNNHSKTSTLKSKFKTLKMTSFLLSNNMVTTGIIASKSICRRCSKSISITTSK